MFNWYINISKNTYSPLADFSDSVVGCTPGGQFLQLALGVLNMVILAMTTKIANTLGMIGKTHGLGGVDLGLGQLHIVLLCSIADGTAGDW